MSNVYKRKLKNKSKIYAFQSVKKAIGDLSHGCEIFGFNKGQFFLIDIVAYILKQIGPFDVDILTWAIGNETIDKIIHLKQLGRIKNLRLIIDYSFRSLHPEYCQKLRKAFGDQAIRVTKNHSKITLLRNDKWNISIRSSMNLNVNRRLEYFEISDDVELMGFFFDFFDEWFETKSTGESFEYPSKYHTGELRKFGKEDVGMDFDMDAGFSFDELDAFDFVGEKE